MGPYPNSLFCKKTEKAGKYDNHAYALLQLGVVPQPHALLHSTFIVGTAPEAAAEGIALLSERETTIKLHILNSSVAGKCSAFLIAVSGLPTAFGEK